VAPDCAFVLLPKMQGSSLILVFISSLHAINHQILLAMLPKYILNLADFSPLHCPNSDPSYHYYWPGSQHCLPMDFFASILAPDILFLHVAPE
jgi:hypothetical protein